jgi:hypothetical protein
VDELELEREAIALEREAVALVKQYGLFMPKPVREFMLRTAVTLGWEDLKRVLK